MFSEENFLNSCIFNERMADMMLGMMGSVFSLFWIFMILMWLVIMVIGIGGFILWIWMLVDAAKRNFPKSDDKVLWILVIVLAGIIGAIIYYFMVKRKDATLQTPSQTTPQSLPKKRKI